MKDVAKAAGVSQPSVSYAYNRPAKLSTETRAHILTTAQAMGYPGPDIRGRSLRSGKVGAIGLMMMDKLSIAFADPFLVALLKGISDVGDLGNVALTLFPLNNNRLAPLPGVADGESLAVRGLVDGLIVSTLPDGHPTVLALVKLGIPFVIVDSPLLEGSHFVGIDDRGAARSQMQHLLALGHRRIGIMVDRLNPEGYSGCVDAERFAISSERIVRERLIGYLEAANDFGLEYQDLKIVEAGGLDATAGHAAAFNLLKAHDITGIAACSDVMALACVKTAREMDIDVPGTLSVIGFDDIPEAVHAGLTTIRQPMVEKGIWAARFLIKALAATAGEPLAPQIKMFATQLIVRSSTRALI